jgi:hypothetical protein
MIEIYISAASAEIGRAEAFAVAAGSIRGVGITHPWWEVMRAVGRPDHELTADERRAHAKADVLGVQRADVVVVLVPSAPSIGLYVELGIAISAQTDSFLVAVGDVEKLGLFGSLVDAVARDETEALAWLHGFVMAFRATGGTSK